MSIILQAVYLTPLSAISRLGKGYYFILLLSYPFLVFVCSLIASPWTLPALSFSLFLPSTLADLFSATNNCFFPPLPTALNFILFILLTSPFDLFFIVFYKALCIPSHFLSFTFFPSPTLLPLHLTSVIISFLHVSHWFTHILHTGPPAYFPQPEFSTNSLFFHCEELG
jgi:hypothetical protein